MIFKPKIKKVLQSVPILLAALTLALSLNTLQTYADDVPSASEAASLIFTDIKGVNGGGSSTRVPDGIVDTRTGYLCYLLGADGTKLNLSAYAFKSPGYDALDGTIWYATSRRGHTVSEWKAVAPWGIRPFNIDKTTNYSQIKSWMEQKDSNGVMNAVDFVDKTWKNDTVTEKFLNGDYVLVCETLLHFRYSVPNEKMQKPPTANSIPIKEFLMEKYNLPKDWQPSEWYLSEVRKELNKLLEEQWEKEGKYQQGYTKVGSPIIGTPSNCLDYYNAVVKSYGPNWFKAFTNNVAPFAEMINPGGAGEKAGFRPWTGSTAEDFRLSESELDNHGLAMFVIKAKDSAQTTAQESQIPTPHPAPVESTGNFSIIKNYRTKEGDTLTDDGCFTTSNLGNQITIESEGKYQVVGWATSSSTSTIDSITWSVPSPITQGTTPTTITLEGTAKSLYVLLEKTEDPPLEEPQDYNYKLTQSSITRRVHFTAPDHRLSMPHIENHNFKWIIPAHQTSCPGHTFTDACHGQHIGPHTSSCEKACPATCTQEHPTGSHLEGCDDPHYYDCGTRCTTQTAYCSGWQWHEQNLKLSINNTQQSNYPDILATKSGWNTEPQNSKLTKHYYLNDASFERTSTSSQSYQESNWDYVAVLLRGKDKLTIAHWQNAGQGNGLSNQANSNLQAVSSSGFAVSNQDSGTRKTQDYMETFSTYFSTEESEGVDNRTYYKSTIDATVDAPDTPKGSTLCGINERKAYISNPLSINNIKVKVETYSGSSSGGTNDTSFNASPVLTLSRQGYDVSSGRMIQTGSTISFRPYIKMKYDTLTATNQPAYVLSEYQRQMTPNAYAEISWNNPGARNLTLTSAQWSTHAQATQNHGTNSVLPGGATLSLNINADNRQQVTVTSYYPIVTGHGKTQIDNAGGSYTNLTEATAQSLHEQFVSSVQQALDTTIIQQYVDTDDTHSNAFDYGIQVNLGSSITELHNGSSTASTEDKYYFRPDNTASGLTEGDLDVQQPPQNTETTYTFFTTTNGALKMTINNTTPKENTPDQGAYSYIGNMLDARTGVRTKLEAAVERHTGSDPEAITGTNWYNEAFDGVTIIQFDTVLTVGFQDPPERSQVLDPKLIPKQVNSTTENKDLFSDYFISQFRTRNYSELNQTPYIMGRYNGQTVQMINLENLFTSRPFYIPNLTTQDLHS